MSPDELLASLKNWLQNEAFDHFAKAGRMQLGSKELNWELARSKTISEVLDWLYERQIDTDHGETGNLRIHASQQDNAKWATDLIRASLTKSLDAIGHDNSPVACGAKAQIESALKWLDNVKITVHEAVNNKEERQK